jgi:hypothetical protein
METLAAMLLLNKRTREFFGFTVDPTRVHGAEEGKIRLTIVGWYYILSCATDQWTWFLFFSSNP